MVSKNGGINIAVRMVIPSALQPKIFVWISFLVLALTPRVPAQIVTNGSFEIPAISPDSFVYETNVPGWTFEGGGLISTPSFFAAPPATDGSQVAFLQSESAGMWQTISLPANATGSYTLTYFVAGRPNESSWGGDVTYNVALDSAIIFSNATTVSSAPFTMETVTFSATPGDHLLSFSNSPALVGDNTAFFDDIEVQVVPSQQIVVNGSFELPTLSSGSFEYSSQAGFSGAGWIYSTTNGLGVIGGDGVVSPPGFGGEPSAVDGSQIAFLQSQSAAIWQTIVLPTNDTYDLVYYFAGRAQGDENSGGNVTGTVLLDSTVLATNTTVSGQPFSPCSVVFTATAGIHVLMFSNSPTIDGDNTMFLDDVQIVKAAPVKAAAYAGLLVNGSAGVNYTVLFADDLLTGSWMALTNVILSNSLSIYFDTTSPGVPGQRFYNCLSPAPSLPASMSLGIYTGYNIQGAAGGNYILQYLNPLPSTAWTSITNITPPTSPYLWLDPSMTGQPKHAFYRAISSP
jgi:hypothetical protein